MSSDGFNDTRPVDRHHNKHKHRHKDKERERVREDRIPSKSSNLRTLPNTDAKLSDDKTFVFIPSVPSQSLPHNPHAPRTINGSLLEGGGQVLRNAFAYAALLQFPLTVENIRGNRPNPGLRSQHVQGVLTLHSITKGMIEGASVRSMETRYVPGNGDFRDGVLVKGRLKYVCDAKTAGAIGLLIQTTLPILIFLPFPVSVMYVGGTNATYAPMFDYTENVFIPILAKMFGLTKNLSVKCIRRGFYPKGGGRVSLECDTILTTPLPSMSLLDRGSLIEIRGNAVVSGNIPISVAERMIASAEGVIKSSLIFNDKVRINLTASAVPVSLGEDDGCFILLVAETTTGCLFGASSIGEIGKPAGILGSMAAKELVDNLQHGGCVDEHIADQLILFMTLAKGVSRMKTGPLSLHTKTAIHWARELTGARISVYKMSEWNEEKSREDAKPHGNETVAGPSSLSELSSGRCNIDSTYIIEVEGIGYVSRWIENEK